MQSLMNIIYFGALQEVSSMILEKLVAAGIGSRPVVFVTHRCVGLVSVSVNCDRKSFMWLTVALMNQFSGSWLLKREDMFFWTE